MVKKAIKKRKVGTGAEELSVGFFPQRKEVSHQN